MRKKYKKQLEFSRVQGWGGKRKGAGRPNLSGQVNHMKRPGVVLKTPMHITLRLKENLPSIRNKRLFREFKTSVKGAKAQGFYVIQFSIQANHVHLFAEAEGNTALALGMRALAGRFAKIVRKFSHSKGNSANGSVFDGRYHLHVLKTPKEVRNALEYVLLNLSKHQRLIEYIDYFSSGKCFGDWRKLLGSRFVGPLRSDVVFWKKNYAGDLKEILSPPRSWLAQTGWMRARV